MVTPLLPRRRQRSCYTFIHDGLLNPCDPANPTAPCAAPFQFSLNMLSATPNPADTAAPEPGANALATIGSAIFAAGSIAFPIGLITLFHTDFAPFLIRSHADLSFPKIHMTFTTNNGDITAHILDVTSHKWRTSNRI
jgi:hypothetical protein